MKQLFRGMFATLSTVAMVFALSPNLQIGSAEKVMKEIDGTPTPAVKLKLDNVGFGSGSEFAFDDDGVLTLSIVNYHINQQPCEDMYGGDESWDTLKNVPVKNWENLSGVINNAVAIMSKKLPSYARMYADAVQQTENDIKADRVSVTEGLEMIEAYTDAQRALESSVEKVRDFQRITFGGKTPTYSQFASTLSQVVVSLRDVTAYTFSDLLGNERVQRLNEGSVGQTLSGRPTVLGGQGGMSRCRSDVLISNDVAGQISQALNAVNVAVAAEANSVDGH